MQDLKSQNDQKEWKACEQSITKLKDITTSFLKYITAYKLDASENPHSIQVKEAKYLPARSLVLSGSQVFQIFWDGTSFDDYSLTGQRIKCDLRSDWLSI